MSKDGMEYVGEDPVSQAAYADGSPIPEFPKIEVDEHGDVIKIDEHGDVVDLYDPEKGMWQSVMRAKGEL